MKTPKTATAVKTAEEIIIETMGRPFWSRMIREYWDAGILKAIHGFHDQFTPPDSLEQKPTEIVLPEDSEINKWLSVHSDFPIESGSAIDWYKSRIIELNNLNKK